MSKSRRSQTQGGMYDLQAQVCTPTPNHHQTSEWDAIGNAERLQRIQAQEAQPDKATPENSGNRDAAEKYGTTDMGDGTVIIPLNHPSLTQKPKPPSPTGRCTRDQYNRYVEAGMLGHSLTDAFPSIGFTTPEEVQQKGRDYADRLCRVSPWRR